MVSHSSCVNNLLPKLLVHGQLTWLYARFSRIKIVVEKSLNAFLPYGAELCPMMQSSEGLIKIIEYITELILLRRGIQSVDSSSTQVMATSWLRAMATILLYSQGLDPIR